MLTCLGRENQLTIADSDADDGLYPNEYMGAKLWTPLYSRSSKSRCNRASGQRVNPTGHPAMPGGLFCTIGNSTSDGTWTYTWEKGRQLKSMSNGSTTASFKYNSDGLRVQKTVGSVVTNYTLHGKNIVHMTQGSNALHFFYDASNKPAIVEYNGTKYAYVHNLQGDIVAILDSNSNVVVQYKYDAWGRIISKTGSLASTLGTLNPFRYRGYVFDEETGLCYLRSRYYDAFSCRFINADVIIECFLSTPRGNNLFSYCYNNCTCYSDATGNVPRLSIQEWKQIREFVLRNELKKAIEQERIVQYDVPVYSQGSYKLCWAFCQVMVEESTSGSPKTQEQAVERAIEIAKSYHRSENMDKWNKGGWPTNLSIWGLGIRKRVTSITDVFDVLKKQGPVYAYYEIKSENRAHLVVVTGVNLVENQIYTNNPWGVAGGQTYEEFTDGVVGSSEEDGWKLRWLIY